MDEDKAYRFVALCSQVVKKFGKAEGFDPHECKVVYKDDRLEIWSDPDSATRWMQIWRLEEGRRTNLGGESRGAPSFAASLDLKSPLVSDDEYDHVAAILGVPPEKKPPLPPLPYLPDKLWRHKKTGHIYRAVCLARDEKTLQPVVVYELAVEDKLCRRCMNSASKPGLVTCAPAGCANDLDECPEEIHKKYKEARYAASSEAPWVRPHSEFMDGRFEWIVIDSYGNFVPQPQGR